MKYKISYTGWTIIEVDADSPEQAEEKFWDDGLNDLYDTEIDEISEA